MGATIFRVVRPWTLLLTTTVIHACCTAFRLQSPPPGYDGRASLSPLNLAFLLEFALFCLDSLTQGLSVALAPLAPRLPKIQTAVSNGVVRSIREKSILPTKPRTLSGVFGWMQNPEHLLIFAAGNSGEMTATSSSCTIGSPAVGKNVLAVGSSSSGATRWSSTGTDGAVRTSLSEEAGDIDTVSWFSSNGPTADDRIKPELVAPGDGVRGYRTLGTIELGRGQGNGRSWIVEKF